MRTLILIKKQSLISMKATSLWHFSLNCVSKRKPEAFNLLCELKFCISFIFYWCFLHIISMVQILTPPFSQRQGWEWGKLRRNIICMIFSPRYRFPCQVLFATFHCSLLSRLELGETFQARFLQRCVDISHFFKGKISKVQGDTFCSSLVREEKTVAIWKRHCYLLWKCLK